MSGMQQFVALMCVLGTALIITFIVMAPALIDRNRSNRKES